MVYGGRLKSEWRRKRAPALTRVSCGKARQLRKTKVYTRKNAQVVTNLQQTFYEIIPKSRYQVVFALLAPCLLTSCYKAC